MAHIKKMDSQERTLPQPVSSDVWTMEEDAVDNGKEILPYDPKSTNQLAELTAMILALRAILEIIARREQLHSTILENK